MQLSTDTAEFIRLCDVLRSKGIDGSMDEFLLEKFRLQKIRKWKPFAKFMRYTYYRPFAKKRIVTGIRFDLLEIKESLFNLHARGGGNEDCTNAMNLIENYLNSLPKSKEKKWEKKDYLLLVLIPSSLSVIAIVVSIALAKTIDWIYPWLAIVGVGILTLLIPLLGGLGSTSLFSYVIEVWWNRHWRDKLGIVAQKDKIIDQTIENPLAH